MPNIFKHFRLQGHTPTLRWENGSTFDEVKDSVNRAKYKINRQLLCISHTSSFLHQPSAIVNVTLMSLIFALSIV